jgi:signal transduction histidine kinase
MASGVLKLGWLRALIAAELLVAVVVTGSLWGLRRQMVAGELHTLMSLSRAMALQSERTLDMASTVLMATQDELARGLIVPGSVEADVLLHERVRPMDAFDALSVFDAQGRRVASSRPAGPQPPADMAQHDLFVQARQAGVPVLYVSAPFRTARGELAESVSLPWRDAEGHFMGVIALLTRPEFLEGGFARIAPTGDTRLTLHRPDGTPLRPDMLPQGDADWMRSVVQGPIDPGQGLSLEWCEGTRTCRLMAVAPLRHYPLSVVVSRDADEALRNWTDTTWLVGVFTASMLGVTLALALRVAADRMRQDRLEAQLQRTRKLEALGKLAGGVAHDFNNVLAAVIGYGEMARRGAGEGSRQAQHLDQVLRAGQRGKLLVERILAFSRGQPHRATVFRLADVVDEVLSHLGGAKRADVRIDARLEARELAVKGDATAVYEAVMNLCTNALQAMPDGGVLEVVLDASPLREPRMLEDRTLPPGRYVRLAVRDTGAGMSPEVLARLFEPFFTTKGTHGGTGLGLAVVHGVVQDMDGAIEVRSEPGKGSRFIVYLPVSDAPLSAAAGADVSSAPPDALPCGQGEVVLVVDDEATLVELTEELLAELGYEPYGKTSSVDALAAFRANPTRFDLILTDEIMPDMTGTALAAAIHEIRPDVPVLLASGFGGPQLEARAASAGVAEVLAKPLTRAELARALDRVLHG